MVHIHMQVDMWSLTEMPLYTDHRYTPWFYYTAQQHPKCLPMSLLKGQFIQVTKKHVLTYLVVSSHVGSFVVLRYPYMWPPHWNTKIIHTTICFDWNYFLVKISSLWTLKVTGTLFLDVAVKLFKFIFLFCKHRQKKIRKKTIYLHG